MKKSPSLLGTTLVSLMLCSAIVNAAQVADLYINVSQSNGLPGSKPFKIHPKGDEWGSWYETDQGYTVIKDEQTEDWHYATQGDDKKLHPSGKILGRDKPETSGINRHIRPEPINQPTFESPSAVFNGPSAPSAAIGLVTTSIVGNVPTLFILVEFTDKLHTYSTANFADLLSNQLSAYFKEVSYGRFNAVPANETFPNDSSANNGIANDGMVGWLQLNKPHPNTAGATGTANQQLAVDAITAADPYVNFADYDRNLDGYVDSNELAVVVIPAGYETAFGGTACTPSPSIWGHRWAVLPALIAPTLDGKIVGDAHNGEGGYAQFGEIHGATAACNPNNTASIKDHIATIGIMAHELGHLILKLPDLYDTTNASQGIGSFSLMAAGNWASKTTDTYLGQSPVHPDAWCKFYSGWVDPIINALGPISLPAAGSPAATATNSVQMQTTSDPKQYFLFENRGQYGYDAGLSGAIAGIAGVTGTPGGLAVWHIDENMRTATNLYSPNNIKTHKFIDLEEADNVSTMDVNTNRGQANDLYFAGNSTGNTAFDDLSLPNSRLYNGSSSGIALNSISAQGEIMSVNFALALLGQTITFSSAPASLTVNLSGSVVATASSGLPVAFSTTTPTICSVTGATITAGSTAGTCNVIANQAGNASFAPAPQVTMAISVNAAAVVISKVAQTITFSTAPASLATKGKGTLAATASSRLAVTFSSLTPTVCSVSKTQVTGRSAGTCTVVANQAGNATFAPATPVTKSFSVR